MLVVDASVLVVALADYGADGDSAHAALLGSSLAAPELIDLEVLSVLRRQLSNGRLDQRRAELALVDLSELQLERAPHRPLLPRCWELRHDITPYDAAYVALAVALEVELLTADRRLASAPGVRCTIRLVS